MTVSTIRACKRISIYILSVLLIVSGGPFQLAFAKAAEEGDELTAEEAEQARILSHQIRSLEAQFAGEGSGQSPLDTFDLLRQTIVDDRKDKISTEIHETKETDFNERLQDLYSELDVAKDIALPEKEKQRYIEFVEVQIDDLVRLGVDGLDVEHFIDEGLLRRHFYKNNLQLKVFDAPSDQVRIELMKVNEVDFKNSTSDSFSTDDSRGLSKKFGHNKKLSFALSSIKGIDLLYFNIPIEAFTFFDRYLVFVEQGTYDPRDQTLPLKFIDLEYFRGNLGNDRLPIYQLPIKIEGGGFESLSIKNGQLKVNNIVLHSSAIKVVSDLYQIIYNISASLVDPDTVTHSKELIKEMALVLNQSMRAQGNLVRTQLETALSQDMGLNQILSKNTQQLESTLALEDIDKFSGKSDLYNKQVKLYEESIKESKEHFRRLPPGDEKETAKQNVAKEELKLLEFKSQFGDISSQELETDLKRIASTHNMNSYLKQTNDSLVQSRGFMSRFHLLLARLAQPHPYGSAKFVESLAMVTTGLSKKDNIKFNAGVNNIKSHGYYKFLKYGAGVTASAVMGAHLPEPYTLDVHNVLDLMNTTVNNVIEYLKYTNYGANYVDLLGTTTYKMMSGVSHAIPNYLGNGNASKFVYGFANLFIIPLVVFGVPHLLINSFKTASEIWKLDHKNTRSIYEASTQSWAKFVMGFENRNSFVDKKWGTSLWAGIKSLPRAPSYAFDRFTYYKNLFVDVQSNSRSEFEKANAKAENRVSGADIELEEYQKLQLGEYLFRLKQKKESSYSSKVVHFVKGPERFINSRRDSLESHLLKTASHLSLRYTEETRRVKALTSIANFINVKQGGETPEDLVKNINTFGRAMKHFLLSYPTVTNTVGFLVTVYNYIFLLRTFSFRPTIWYMVMAYPGYFGSVTNRFDERLHLPTRYNGGLRPHWTYWPLRIGEKIGFPSLVKLRQVERNVLPIEKEVFDIAVQKAQVALITKTKDPKRLLMIFDSSLPTAKDIKGNVHSSSGISSLTDRKLKKLTSEERSFFRAYFDKMFEEVMNTYLRNEVVSRGYDGDANQLTARSLVRLSKEHAADFIDSKDYKQVSSEKAAEIKQKARAIADNPIIESAVYNWAENASVQISKLYKRAKMNYNHNIMRVLDPRGAQMGRVNTVNKKKKDPKSMARGVRSQTAELLVSTGLSLVFTLLFYAEMQSGMLMPFNPNELDGPDHYKYMSRYLFYQGFVVSMIIGVMANVWYKLQVDDRIDSAGGFDKEVLHRDQKRGFWRYYFKSATKHPDNKWKDNQFHMLKLVTANIPATLAMYIPIYLWTIGRIEINALIASYLLLYLTPMIGIDTKIEQGFEIASKWVNGRIPRKYRADPRAQNYINSEIQLLRAKFTFVFAAYGQVVGKAQEIFQLYDSEKYGSKAFLRFVFFGWTPIEAVASISRSIAELGEGIPGVRKLAEAIEYLFTNEYQTWGKIAPNPNLEKATGFFDVLSGRAAERSAELAVGTGAAAAVMAPFARERNGMDPVQFKFSLVPACSQVFIR